MLKEIKFLCKLYDISPNPRVGQHFLISEKILKVEVECAEITEDDVVLDIGAGFGYLTEMLAKKAKKVYAVEKDPKIAEVFRWRLGSFIKQGKVDLIIADVLKISFSRDITKVVSNPPYHIISDIIIKVLKELFTLNTFKLAVMILQKEYAERLLAGPGDKNWGRIGACFRYFADGEIVLHVPNDAFWPQPEVDSVLVRFWPIRMKHIIDFNTYEKTTAILFTAARRTLRKVLTHYLRHKDVDIKYVIEEIKRKVDINKRVRSLTVKEIEEIGFIFKEMGII